MNKRIASLDGIRAVAIFAVILFHIGERFSWPHSNTLASTLLVGHGGGVWAGDGVGIFFVLSGFLITTLLIREFERSGKIAISAFYARRAFRILPPLLVYLGFVLVFCIYEHVPFKAQNFTSALFFYRDYYFTNDLWATQHTWSLSVEEQFYLLWPIGLLFLLRYRSRAAASRVALGLILMAPLLRVSVSMLKIPAITHQELYMLHCRMDSLMCGCFVALCADAPRFEAVYRKLAKVWWIFPLEFWGVSLLLGNVLGITYRKSIGLTIDSIAIAFFILWATRNGEHWVGRILNSPVMVRAGVLSYSAYLWQTFFLHAQNKTFAASMPLCLILIWIAAWCSYSFVELPSLRLREFLLRRPAIRKTALATEPPENAPIIVS